VLNEPVFVTINGRHQQITKREAVTINCQQIHQRRFARDQDAASMYSSTKRACWGIKLPLLETDAHGFDRALTRRGDVEWRRAT